MNKQTEAERLADEHERDEWIASTRQWRDEAAAELRRLVSFNQQLMDEVARLQKREWSGLNWDELPDTHFGDVAFLKGAQWAAAKLKEKNT